MEKYKTTKRRTERPSNGLENKPFKRFIEIERSPAEDVLFYIHEIIEIIYHTIMPFIAGYYLNSDLPYRWVAFGILLMPLVFRFAYSKKEKKTKIYFRL